MELKLLTPNVFCTTIIPPVSVCPSVTSFCLFDVAVSTLYRIYDQWKLFLVQQLFYFSHIEQDNNRMFTLAWPQKHKMVRKHLSRSRGQFDSLRSDVQHERCSTFCEKGINIFFLKASIMLILVLSSHLYIKVIMHVIIIFYHNNRFLFSISAVESKFISIL